MHRSFFVIFCALLAVPTAKADLVAVAPEAGLFQFRPDLAGQHPRLHFSATDIPEIRARHHLAPAHVDVPQKKENPASRSSLTFLIVA